MSNKQQTAVEWLVEQFENHRATFFKLNDKEERVITLAGRDVVEQSKEMEKERMIKLIQFVVSEKELVDYSSVSNDTANYYLDKFNQGGNK
jgi:hypothetical protein